MSEPYYVGIDVSIDRLDVAIRPGGRGFCVTNYAAGWAELVARLPQGAIAAIGLEPSGGYERGIVRVLLAAGFSKVAIVAVMGKMLTTLNAMLRDGNSWTDEHSGRHTVPAI